VRLQYPHEIGGGYREQYLAEAMLPDGVHNRTEDCTFFFVDRNLPKSGGRSPHHGSITPVKPPPPAPPVLVHATAYKYNDSTSGLSEFSSS